MGSLIELIPGLPDGVVGIEAVGRVTDDDYEQVASPAVEDALSRHEKIRLVHVLGERFEGHSAAALWEDAKLGKHVRSFERIAVVTDLKSFGTMMKVQGWALPGTIRLFPSEKPAAALAWASEGL